MLRYRLLGLCAGLTLVGGAFVATSPAHAAGQTCSITGTAHINPGLSSKSRPFTDTFKGKFVGCLGGPVKSGIITESGSGKGGCTSAKTSGIANVAWNNGKTSTIALTTTGVGSVLYVKGKFTSGLFKGSNSSAVLNFLANPAQCFTTGVKTASFVGQGTIS